ncbi:MAG TPA: CehA/McbA family metallohydrolase, partial [Gemmataceae bacterium]|nr:CehA/McbA family metallohydrolase [Gemmataceae bacterium]
ASIEKTTRAKVVVLNHPRDLHAGFRPLGPERHVAVAGEDLDGWELRANAIEVVNSGAQQSDVMRPFHDWFGLLNRGVRLAPVGASDSHDVSRFIVGQARTYIRCKSDRPGRVDADEAAKSLADGRVLVSCGLLADVTVNGRYGPGDLAPASGEVKVAVRVLGPAWTTADHVELYANGHKVREERIRDGKRAGVKWSGEWALPPFKHDTYLVAVASGPGVTELYWPIARPYQPTSPVVERRVLGATGAVWLDADGDGKWISPRGYAERLLRAAGDDWRPVLKSLADYDEAVAVQAASLLRARGVSPRDADVRAAARQAGAQVGRGFDAYAEAWRECQVARK